MTDYTSLLKVHDDPRNAEWPPGFDLSAAETKFTKMAKEIVAAFPGSHFETGTAIQDASFHGQIFVALAGDFASLRVSNFGSLATVTDEDDCLDAVSRSRLLDTLAAHGYTFIPADILDQPYDGTNPGVTGFRTWWCRYFDWL
jgi:hypothetical protein